jgi:DNA-binding NarL/FixJ family response regulator
MTPVGGAVRLTPDRPRTVRTVLRRAIWVPVDTGTFAREGTVRDSWKRETTGVRPSSPNAWADPAARPILLPVAGDRGRVVVADDDVLLREGLGSLLVNAGFDVVGQVGEPTQLLALARELRPELVIVDIRMPPTRTTEGLDAARVIREELPEIAILVLSAHVEVEEATELLAGGKSTGYLLKDRVSDVDDFLDTLDRIVKGASVVDPALVHELLAARRVEDPLRALSQREREVLALMAEGRSNVGIAHQLWVTEGTVEKHVRSILMKLRIPEASDDHRRVLAVLTFLDSH